MSGAKVRILDTTLRDGAQAWKFALSDEQTLFIARWLMRLNVDIIEAGFPVSSNANKCAVAKVALLAKDHAQQFGFAPTIAALCRCNGADIQAGEEALKDAPHGRLHVFVATSAVHREFKLRETREGILVKIKESVTRAVQTGLEVQFSPEDAYRTFLEEPRYLIDAVGTALDAGATIINLPDTIGLATPTRYGKMFEAVGHAFKELLLGTKYMSTHCHDDRGLATANSLEGVAQGARQVEVTNCGLGERAGNADLAQIAANIFLDGPTTGFETQIVLKEVIPIARALEKCLGFRVPDNRAIIGRNARVHRSGIHQHGAQKRRDTYECIPLELFGGESNNLAFNGQSGITGVTARLAELGYPVEAEEVERLKADFEKIKGKKMFIDDSDLVTILMNIRNMPKGRIWEFVRYDRVANGGGIKHGKILLTSPDGNLVEKEGSGDGDLSAACSAILAIVGLDGIELERYDVSSVGMGLNSLAQADVEVTYRFETYSGLASDTDVLEASIMAFLSAVNRVLLVQDSRKR